MKNKGEKIFCVHDQTLNNVDTVKKTIVKLHKNNKSDVPQYLDELKKEKKIRERDASFDNDFLKYMI